LRLPYERLLEFKKSKFRLIKVDVLCSELYRTTQVVHCPGLSLAISAQFTLKMCAAAKKLQKH